MTRTVGGVQDLVVENGKVEGQAKADGVGWGKLGLGNIGSVLKGKDVRMIRSKSEVNTNLVSLVGSSGSNLALLARSKFSQVAVVITLPALRKLVSK